MDLGKILSTALKYPLSLKPFAILLAVNILFSYFALYLFGSANAVETMSVMVLIGLLLPLVVAGGIVTMFLATLYIDNTAKYFSGHRKPLGGSLPTAKKKFLKLLGTEILMLIILSVASIPLFILILFEAGLPGILIGGLFIAVSLFFIFLAPNIAVIEKGGILDSVKISIGVIRKHMFNAILFWIGYLAIVTTIGVVSLITDLTGLDPATIALQSIVTTYNALFSYSALTNFYLTTKKK